ncbi:MAG: transcriptional regulator [Bacteroides sp. SM23_62_1]|nr:MAG: transcriptional regulator [Bacteroides sp. SM23_62_1]
MTERIKLIQPTDAELEVLHILWENGPSTVRFVNDRLNERKNVGYTTTLKIMQIMHEKGILTRNKKDRTHIYTTVLEEDETQSLLVEKLLKIAFDGSASKLVMQTLGNRKTSKEELQKIKDLIEKIEKDQP